MKTPPDLQPLIDDGVIDEVLRSLKSGKEATVYLVRSGSQVRCAKDREQYRIFGIDPESVNILVCKGINHFRADFEPIARELIFVDTGADVNHVWGDGAHSDAHGRAILPDILRWIWALAVGGHRTLGGRSALL